MNGGVLKAATNEWVLMAFRGSTSICLAIITIYVIGTRDDTKLIAKDLADFKVAYAERIAHVEGQVAQINGSVEAHRQRLNSNDADIRSIWTRIFDLTTRLGGGPVRAAP